MSSSLAAKSPLPVILPGSVFLITSDGRVLHLPIPSPSAKDPLNWSSRKRAYALASLMFYTVVGLVLMQGPGQLLDVLHLEYSAAETKPFRLELVASISSLFMGLGAIIWTTMSIGFGRRPVVLISSLFLVLGTVWAAASRNFYQHLAARCVQGLAAGITATTIPLIIIDLTFIHRRPQAIAAYSALGSILSNIPLSTTPHIVRLGTLGHTWRAFYWFWSVPCVIACLLLYFLFPETYFQRPAIAFDGHILVQSASEQVHVYEGWDAVEGGKTLPDLPEKAGWRGQVRKLSIFSANVGGGWKGVATCYKQTLMCLFNPLIFWATALNAIIFAGIVSLSTTFANVLHNEPYRLSPEIVALVQLSAAVGALIAWPASGVMIAHLCRRLAARNNGVRDAEHYIPAFVLPILTGGVALLIYGFAVELRWHWMWIYFALGLNFFSFISFNTAIMLWVTEAFPRWAGAALIVVVGGGRLASFAVTFAVAPWIKALGFARAHGVLSLLMLGAGLLGVPVAIWGKRFRKFVDSRWGAYEGSALRPQ